MAFDLGRLKGTATALSAVIVALAGCSLIAQGVARELPRWLIEGDSTMEGGQDTVVGGRIAAALADARRKGWVPANDLGVLLGPSSVNMGLVPAILEAEADDRIPSHWLSLAANGANFSDLRGPADLLLGGGLRPKLLILGIHRGMLVRSEDYLSDPVSVGNDDLRRLGGALKAGKVGMIKIYLPAVTSVPLNRAFPNRTRISHHTRMFAIELKRRLFTALGLGADSIYTPDPDPWGVPLLIPDDGATTKAQADGRRVAARELREGVAREGFFGDAKDKGWSKAKNYSADGANARSLAAIIEAARARGTEIVILLMPESTIVRNQTPPEAMDCLRELLQRRFGAAAPPVIDLLGAIPDDLYHDSLHLNRAGREMTTRLLVKALRARNSTPSSAAGTAPRTIPTP